MLGQEWLLIRKQFTDNSSRIFMKFRTRFWKESSSHKGKCFAGKTEGVHQAELPSFETRLRILAVPLKRSPARTQGLTICSSLAATDWTHVETAKRALNHWQVPRPSIPLLGSISQQLPATIQAGLVTGQRNDNKDEHQDETQLEAGWSAGREPISGHLCPGGLMAYE